MGTSYTIMFAQPIDKADRVTLTINIPETDAFMGRLDVLPGDFDDNGAVNNKDVTANRNEWKGKHGAQPTIFGVILGDSTVTASDYNMARKRIGTKPPKIGSKPAVAADDATARDVRDNVRVRRRPVETGAT